MASIKVSSGWKTIELSFYINLKIIVARENEVISSRDGVVVLLSQRWKQLS
jgi:hypothetical protein